MFECIDPFIQELWVLYTEMELFNQIFQIIETNMLEASDDTLSIPLENLIEIHYEFDKDQMLQEIGFYVQLLRVMKLLLEGQFKKSFIYY